MLMHSQQLKQIRSQMEAVRGGGSVPGKLFEEGKSCVETFKKDQKDLSALLTMRERKDRQPKTMQPAAA